MKGTNVLVDRIDWVDVNYYPSLKSKEFSKYLLSEGDIVIAMDRPFISEGFKIARISKNDIPCLLVQRIGRFEKKDSILYDYVYHYLHSYSFQKSLKNLQKGSDLPHISKNEILTPMIPIPPSSEQNQISSILNNIDKKIKEETRYSLNLQILKKGLMQKLLTGNIYLT